MLLSAALIVLNAKQDVNLTWLSCLGLKNWKINLQICENEEKNWLAVRMEWII